MNGPKVGVFKAAGWIPLTPRASEEDLCTVDRVRPQPLDDDIFWAVWYWGGKDESNCKGQIQQTKKRAID